MRKLLILIFSFLSIATSAQIRIEGMVLFNTEPIENATVFLNNTSKGTITNSDGVFSIEVSEGSYQLIVSHIGYKTIEYTLDTSTYNEPLTFLLEEEEFALDEVVVSATKNDADRQYNLSVFIREFIGTSEFAKQCVITNLDILQFCFDAQTNRLSAEAREPLRIQNKALGYEIYFDLEHFSVHNNFVSQLGYSYFKPLDGSKRKQRKWQKNRLEAYRGSPIHFFKSVLNNKTEEEGFIINQFERKVIKPTFKNLRGSTKQISASENQLSFSDYIKKYGKVPRSRDVLYNSDISSSTIISVDSTNTYLEFDDNLSVVYTEEKEEKGYVLKSGRPRKALPQTSNLLPLTEKSLILPIGILENPLSIVFEGYWSYEKFAHTLPLDYEPMN